MIENRHWVGLSGRDDSHARPVCTTEMRVKETYTLCYVDLSGQGVGVHAGWRSLEGMDVSVDGAVVV